MIEQIIVGLIAALIGTVAFVVDCRWEVKIRKEESKMNDRTRTSIEELSKSFAELGRAGMFDGPIGADTLTAIYNPNTMITAVEPAREDDKPLVARVCPQCGAPVRGDECEYCGSVFIASKNGLTPIKLEFNDNHSSTREIELRPDGLRSERRYNPDTMRWEWVSENPMKAVRTSVPLTKTEWR